MERARLDWSGGAPRSARFGDSYFSSEGGLAESRAVFLQGCGLPDAWRGGAAAGNRLFRIGELGFGTGLNALAVWDCWRRARTTSPQSHDARLVMVSVEGFPLGVEDAARAHAAFPDIAELAARLRGQWPAAAPGAHLLDFPEDGFTLIVIHDEAGAALAGMEGAFDAWFLDGFAPARNPDMWRPELFARIAALSAPGARAASFTVAGHVRRALADAGFAVEKRPGFGRKRERLEARLENAPQAAAAPDMFPRGAAMDGGVLILGGGIAGCALAHALRARGRAASIVSAGPPASLPPAALLTPRLENADWPHARALFAAFHHAAGLYARLGAFDSRGARRLPKDGAAADRLRALAARWPGLAWDGDALVIPSAGVLPPARVLDALAADTPRLAAHAADIQHKDGLWRLFDDTGTEIAAAPILALAAGASGGSGAAAPLLAPLDLRLTGGQVSLHRAVQPLPMAATWGGFAAPCGVEDVLIGATHDAQMHAAPPAPDPARARALAEEAAARLPDCGIDSEPRAIWTGVRAAAADRLPLAGPVPDADAYAAAFAAMAEKNASGGVQEGFPPGLYVLTGLGSRGFAHAPLLAHSVAAEICGEPAPLDGPARRALHPARILHRRLKRVNG